MQKQILVIEDDEILNAGLCYNLQKRDMLPFSAGSIEEAKKLMKQETFDLILLDINLPDGSGFDFAKETVAHQNIPFLFLTAHNLEEEMIQGLRTGADDYITKPFSIRVLMEKIQAVLRRCGGTQKPQPYACGNLVIDFENRLVKSRGSTVALTPTEFEILETLCRSRGQILTKDVLLEKIWDRKENYVSEHALSLNISRLRSKIADGEYEYIRTVYGLGYQWTGGQK
ncbi:MAG: response regulator transcription factor [Eubacterium sp.]|jgi:DNA-binding response OmpR family regulator|nr:response regulator transcription factor [Eubacterium sp.]